MRKPVLSPRNDFVFKRLFGDARDTSLLTEFLKSTLDLPAEDYQEVRIADPHLSGERLEDKEGILDVKVKTPSGKRIDIEIQVVEHPLMRERLVFYLARMVTEQIGKGEGYQAIKRSISIVITDYLQIPENRSYHNRYRLYDRQTGSEFTDLLEVNTLELPKLPEKEDGTALWNWLEFLNARKEEDLMKLAEKNPQIEKAVLHLMALSEDEQTRLLAESREKLQRDIAARENAAVKGGWEEGREEGCEEAQLVIARRLLGLGLSIDEIVKATELSPDAIRTLH
ncbi:MAG: Rpn family recombination-promoting nuclease/putative transposase [Candidatus Accumulibacter sp.]|nr:Rpn family recombination-promoting nuclease/putative transposase [Accumulibacter sp.]